MICFSLRLFCNSYQLREVKFILDKMNTFKINKNQDKKLININDNIPTTAALGVEQKLCSFLINK